MITLVFALLVAGIALSTEAELHIERGRADLGAARVEDARIHALLAFEFDDSSHEAYRLYIDVMLAGGLGPKALTDTNGLVVVDPPYKEAVEQVRVALKAEDPKAAVATVRALQTEWPDRPDLLAVLWEIDLDHGKVAREKARILDFVVDALPKTDDPLYAFRARRLLIEVQADAEPAVEALTRLGESYAPIFGPMRRVDRSEVARALAKDTDPELPQALPEDVLDIAEKLSHNLLREGKGTAAVAMWERHRARHESAKAAVGHARVLLELEHYQTALDVADQALVLAVDPSERDLAAIQDRAIRDGLSDALMVRAAAWSGLHHPAGAMVDLTVANQLQSETLDAVLEKRIRKEILPMKSAVQARYGGNEPAVRAVEKSRKLAGIDPKSAMDPLGDAFFLYCIPTQTDTTSFFALPWLADLAEAHALQAQIYNRLAMPDQARIAATLSTLLHNGVNARVWRDRAALHEEAGHIEAAFASWATARGLHADGAEAFDYDTALERTYDGPGAWLPAADIVAQVTEKASEDGKGRIRVYRNRLLVPRRPAPTGGGAAASRLTVTVPKIGEQMPAWSVKTETGGTISSDKLRGRTMILTFWASYCETCLQMLPELNTLARQLRREGHDVAVVGISVDDEKGAFKTVERVGQRWGDLVYDPDLAVRFGVAALPSTWIVDAHGNVRYFVDSWAGSRHFGRQIRRVIVE